MELAETVLISIGLIGTLITLNRTHFVKRAEKKGEKALNEAINAYEIAIDRLKSENKSLRNLVWRMQNGASQEMAQAGDKLTEKGVLSEIISQFAPDWLRKLVPPEQIADLALAHPEIVRQAVSYFTSQQKTNKGQEGTIGTTI